MGLFGNKGSANDIALQNIVLGINEKKLEVSPEFLDDMTKLYISKRMKVINENVSAFESLKNVSIFYTKFDATLKLLDELIEIEKYHRYNSPTPSEYKQQLEDKKTSFINKIITRKWRNGGYAGNDPENNESVKKFFDEYRKLYDVLPEDSITIVNDLHREIYGYGLMEEPPAPAEELSLVDDENAEEVAAE
ncbi:MAG: hypothetical protein IJ446_06125 [Oscillospiraceae bacterium]|nr:hypothetical protein [Oscillospiraceae bacterium]